MAARPVGCSPASAAARSALPRRSISARLSRRSRGALASLRTPLAGLASIFPRRTACSKIACKRRDGSRSHSFAACRCATAAANRALSRFCRRRCRPARLRCRRASASQSAAVPSNGLMWDSMRLRSIASVDALMARRRRPRMRPASASAIYQSQISATVSASGRLRFFGDRVDALGHGDELFVGESTGFLDRSSVHSAR